MARRVLLCVNKLRKSKRTKLLSRFRAWCQGLVSVLPGGGLVQLSTGLGSARLTPVKILSREYAVNLIDYTVRHVKNERLLVVGSLLDDTAIWASKE
jgi:hypothetical protein